MDGGGLVIRPRCHQKGSDIRHGYLSPLFPYPLSHFLSISIYLSIYLSFSPIEGGTYTVQRTDFSLPLRLVPDVLPIFTQICSKRESRPDPEVEERQNARKERVRENTNVYPAASIWAACDLCAHASFLLLLAL